MNRNPPPGRTGRAGGTLVVEYLVRTKESLFTYIPLDPSHSLQEAEAMLASHHVGRSPVP